MIMKRKVSGVSRDAELVSLVVSRQELFGQYGKKSIATKAIVLRKQVR